MFLSLPPGEDLVPEQKNEVEKGQNATGARHLLRNSSNGQPSQLPALQRHRQSVDQRTPAVLLLDPSALRSGAKIIQLYLTRVTFSLTMIPLNIFYKRTKKKKKKNRCTYLNNGQGITGCLYYSI